jgi:lantibiotic modifying enzyme
MTGSTGVTLFELYYAKFCCDVSKGQEKTNIVIDNFFSTIEGDNELKNSFCSGLTGIAWLIEHIQSMGFAEIDSTDFLSEIDDYVLKFMQDSYKYGYYDFLHGAGGAAWYKLNKLQGCNSEIIQEVYQYLQETAEYVANGARWKSVLSITTLEKGYNIGLAHGISSIIILLCKMYVKYPSDNILSLLQAAVNFVISQKNHSELSKDIGFFPTYSIDDDNRLGISGSRMAWCYGDLGVGIALWQASNILKDKSLEDMTIKIFMQNANRKTYGKTAVKDAGLCHGTSGIAAIYYRMYHNTGKKDFLETADFWIEQTINFHTNSKDFAGYRVWTSDKLETIEINHSLLEGIAGIGLMLITYLHEIPPTWDELLMLS